MKSQLCKKESLILVLRYCTEVLKWDTCRHKLPCQEKLFLLQFRIWVSLCTGVRFVLIGQTFTYSTRLVLQGPSGVVCGSDTWSSSVKRMLSNCISMFQWRRKRRWSVFCFPLLYITCQKKKESHFVKSINPFPLNCKERRYRIRRIPLPKNQVWFLCLFFVRLISLICEAGESSTFREVPASTCWHTHVAQPL